MRNRYPGRCYRCMNWTPKGEGHFEKHKGGWRVHCVACAVANKKGITIEQILENVRTGNHNPAYYDRMRV